MYIDLKKKPLIGVRSKWAEYFNRKLSSVDNTLQSSGPIE